MERAWRTVIAVSQIERLANGKSRPARGAPSAVAISCTPGREVLQGICLHNSRPRASILQRGDRDARCSSALAAHSPPQPTHSPPAETPFHWQ